MQHTLSMLPECLENSKVKMFLKCKKEWF